MDGTSVLTVAKDAPGVTGGVLVNDTPSAVKAMGLLAVGLVGLSVFHPLTKEHIAQIVTILLREVQRRRAGAGRDRLRYADEVREAAITGAGAGREARGGVAISWTPQGDNG